jgi:hypothetical protein
MKKGDTVRFASGWESRVLWVDGIHFKVANNPTIWDTYLTHVDIVDKETG